MIRHHFDLFVEEAKGQETVNYLKHKATIYLLLLSSISAFAQMDLELGVNYMDGSFSIAGVGGYIASGYLVNKNTNIRLHLGMNSFIGNEQGRTKSGRITSGKMPTIRIAYIKRFSKTDRKEIPYLGFGGGTYYSIGDPQLFNDPKVGASLSAGLLFGRSNIGVTFNLIPNYSFIEIGYGFRIITKN